MEKLWGMSALEREAATLQERRALFLWESGTGGNFREEQMPREQGVGGMWAVGSQIQGPGWRVVLGSGMGGL